MENRGEACEVTTTTEWADAGKNAPNPGAFSFPCKNRALTGIRSKTLPRLSSLLDW